MIQEECFPLRSKVVTVGAMQCIHLGTGHSGIELGRKRDLMMDAIQQIVWGIGHSVVELGRKMKDRLYFLNLRSFLKSKRQPGTIAPQILLRAIEKIP